MTVENRTFDDDHGAHALVYDDDDGDQPHPRRVDVNHIVGGSPFHPTRLNPSYRPRHQLAASESAAGR